MNIPNRSYLLLLLMLCQFLRLSGQETSGWKLITPADSLDKVRFWISVGGGTAAYTAATIGLSQTWYSQYEQVGFHTFNDLGEWNQMDKMGHLVSSYVEADLVYGILNWTGASRPVKLWTAVGSATLFQGTLEVLDGFSAKWGFSWSDIGFNTLGVATFAAQELAWQEQRIRIKVSSLPESPYSTVPLAASNSDATSSARQRATELFGHTYLESFLKDYNATTIWASVNINAFRQQKPGFPNWLNLAVGFGAENLYGGFSNQWTDDQGAEFMLPADQYPRYRQFYLSLDLDLTRIKTKSRVLRTLFRSLNWIKIPAPALELNTQGKVRLHPIFW